MAALLALSSCCRRAEAPGPRLVFDGAPARAPEAAAPDADAAPDAAPDAGGVRRFCVRQRRPDLGAPVHRERGGRGGYVRLDQCARVTLIEGDDRWARVAMPLTEGRTEGWMSRRYLINCDGCAEAPDAGAALEVRASELCPGSAPTGREQLSPTEELDSAEVGGGARGLVGAKVVVGSYNLWEIYDGRGEDAYLAADAHGGVPAEQFDSRLTLFASSLRRQSVDLLALQEIDSAASACALAHRAWPQSGWSCFATAEAGVHQHVAVASRLKGRARWLRSRSRRTTGPRGALEFSVEASGGLTVTAVHLKSSRGQRGRADCDNAKRRMGAVAALLRRYRGWSSVLITGDFNFDPLGRERVRYDRSAQMLAAQRFERLCPASGCDTPTFPRAGDGSGSALDLAFFRGGGAWRPGPVEVLTGAPHRRRERLGSDHLPLVVELRRP